jgi:hypothetical protein
MPELPGSLVGKVMDVAAEIHDPADPADVGSGLERVLGLELAPDEITYLESLGQKVLLAVLAARPQ